MGMPSINITFTELAKTVTERAGSKTVGLILPSAATSDTLILAPGDKIPSSVSATDQEQIQRALMGGMEQPKKVIVYFAGTDYAKLDDILEKTENEEIAYLALASEKEGMAAKVSTFVIQKRAEGGTMKAVLPNCEADSEAVINFATNSITVGEKEYEGSEYCGRIAGILAGTPITSSCTYFLLSEADDCERLTKDEADTAIDDGKLIVFYDAGDVRIARGVNSLCTTTETKGRQHKKIKIVDIMDTIKIDIRKTIHDDWIGKRVNTYDNKCLLISAIQNYLNDLVSQGVLESAQVEIDTEANKDYLNKQGIDTTELSYDELKRANTGEEVFLMATIKIVDAIEDITIEITI